MYYIDVPLIGVYRCTLVVHRYTRCTIIPASRFVFLLTWQNMKDDASAVYRVNLLQKSQVFPSSQICVCYDTQTPTDFGSLTSHSLIYKYLNRKNNPQKFLGGTEATHKSQISIIRKKTTILLPLRQKTLNKNNDILKKLTICLT